MESSSRISRIRSRERENLRGPPWIKVLRFPRLAMSIILWKSFRSITFPLIFIAASVQTLQKLLLSCVYTSLDYAQTGLIAAVFFFKVSWLIFCNKSQSRYFKLFDYVFWYVSVAGNVPIGGIIMASLWILSPFLADDGMVVSVCGRKNVSSDSLPSTTATSASKGNSIEILQILILNSGGAIFNPNPHP